MKGFFRFSKFRIILCAGLCLAAFFFCAFGGTVWRFYFGEGNTFRASAGSLAVHFVDVGQGDCIIIQLPDGKVAVIDGGDEMYAARVANYLRTRVVGRQARIDWLINTHPHRDHMGSFKTLIEQFDVGVIYRPHNLSQSPLEPKDSEGNALALGPDMLTTVYSDFITAAEESSAEVRFIESGISITDGQYYEIFFHTPTLDMIARLNEDVPDDFNEISPIITVRFGSTVFVLTGDAGASSSSSVESEQMFIQMDTANQIDFANSNVFLKVGHHGSDSGTREEFLDFIKPNVTVISYGADNNFGFPHSLMMNRLKKHVSSEKIYETAKHGNVAVRVQGDKTHIFIGFYNPPNLALLWVVIFVGIIFFSFFDYSAFRTLKPELSNSSDEVDVQQKKEETNDAKL